MSLTVSNTNQATTQIVQQMCNIAWHVAERIVGALVTGTPFMAPVAGTVHLMSFNRTCPDTVSVTWLTSV